ncbi:hypothetical protein QSV08_14075 [Maribacter sp. BPC-D8]|uniref:hypothetical protein n=1 Tax=Maribacter sp. BPC-D8 TaxID=3053613 RepID=UPI002B48AB23|nr:hypothetical protein [Maribacter sp. BPC-D8]WRI28346.1 hypothetical protein QSV08_14075 [Maribacter sp. BPC-D8]
MKVKESFVFQTDSEEIKSVYENNNNYVIEIDESQPKEYCIIYFSSNNIYYPNTQEVFDKEIVDNNKFEWYGTRIKKGHKHILLRDIKKQWYLTGVNSKVNNPVALLDFLKEETKGYSVITIGSSSGGFAAVLYGQQLGADIIYSFNGQFEVNSLLKRSSEMIDPIVFRENENNFLNSYYDVLPFIKNPNTIHYFCSRNSSWDNEQFLHISQLPLNIYHFKTGHHGIPFVKSILPVILNLPVEKYDSYIGKKMNPVLFSIRVGGLKLTLKGLWQIVKQVIQRKFKA